MSVGLLPSLAEYAENPALMRDFHLIIERTNEEELHAFFEKNTSFLMYLLVNYLEVMWNVVNIYGGGFGEKKIRFIPILRKMISDNKGNPLIELLMETTDLKNLIT